MAENTDNTNTSQEIHLEGNTYEIIQNRLNKQKGILNEKLTQLNAARKDVFGSLETKLLSTDRINTENNSIAKDIIAIDNICVFGYNVHIGLRSAIKLSDVFSIYSFREGHFHNESLEILEDEEFLDSFTNLFKYYRDTVFVKFSIINNYLYMVFQISENVSDIKVFKWIIQDEKIKYIDDRSAHEFKYPPQHEFEWLRAQRDMHVEGTHPHVNINDKVFVETVGGDLTIKIEDNTDSGMGLYEEPVNNPDQTLDDAEYHYADLNNLILLKIRPYQEDFRHYIYNHKVKEVVRIDTIKDAAILLPDQQGVIFSNGYYLQTGENKIFGKSIPSMKYDKTIAAPNGEDFLFVFYNPDDGVYILMSYNIIEQTVNTPIICNGYTCFTDGTLVYFKSEKDPTKHHAVQIWQTPYSANDFIPDIDTNNYLYKIGNKNVVKAMAECYNLLNLLNKQDSYEDLYDDVMQESGDIVDSYYWINEKSAYEIGTPLSEIKNIASTAIGEFEKVVQSKKEAAALMADASEKTATLKRTIGNSRYEKIDDFIEVLASIRKSRGEIIALKEQKYIDNEKLTEFDNELLEFNDKISAKCVQFLTKDSSLNAYNNKIEEVKNSYGEIKTNTEGKKLTEEANKIGTDLELLIETVSNLKIEDATQTTQILDRITALFAQLNQVKAAMNKKMKELFSKEAVSEFNAQLKLLDQGMISYLNLVETPEQCDEYLTKLMIQLEELEGKYSEFSEFIEQISEKRESLYNAFDARKIQIVEKTNKRSTALQASAERILSGINNKVAQFESPEEIHGFFASDFLIGKVRDIVKQLLDIKDPVKADDINNKLKSLQEESIRQLKDKKELFVDGTDVIKFGENAFNVNTQVLDFTIVPKNDDLLLHLTGTNFYEIIKDEDFHECRPVWNQAFKSESNKVYRSEYLAWEIFKQYGIVSEDKVQETVQSESKQRIEEGYVNGIHDEDALSIYKNFIAIHKKIESLAFTPNIRAIGILCWESGIDKEAKTKLSRELQATGAILQVFPSKQKFDHLKTRIESLISDFIIENNLTTEENISVVANFLLNNFIIRNHFQISVFAQRITENFQSKLKGKSATKKYTDSTNQVKDDPIALYHLNHQWLLSLDYKDEFTDGYISEAAVLLSCNLFDVKNIHKIKLETNIDELRGEHPLIPKEGYQLKYHDFIDRLETHNNTTVPLFNLYKKKKKELFEKMREEIRIDEFKPRVLSSFVRNKLIDKVYLPLIGDNLAKQIGVAGDNTRTDRSGLLLLISPPGYGKTTLMEYISSRLGLVFMKINGPAIGHEATSIDPESAPYASAKEELQKLNLALEMGDNIMLYIDDIQHCHPEFLQKFISLCDAQRKIEGVYKGKSKTYDFRGKKVCVVMAGNPYTESGERFRVPDMLANRADIYNLGDIIGDSKEMFELSMIENAITANPVLRSLNNKNRNDLYKLIEYAQSNNKEGLEFESNHTEDELTEYISVLKKMFLIRDTLLTVNYSYIKSAGQNDEYRTEPAFKLQGSYRDMNKLTSKVVAIMNDEELRELILSHYISESQTLTSDAEANLLKFKELTKIISPEEQKRWDEIKAQFHKNNRAKNSDGSERMLEVISQLSQFTENLEGIKEVLEKGLDRKVTFKWIDKGANEEESEK